MLSIVLERGGGSKGCRATRRHSCGLEWEYIVDELSEVEQDGRRRADLRVQPIETSDIANLCERSPNRLTFDPNEYNVWVQVR